MKEFDAGKLLDLDIIGANLDANANGSNALVLFGKKKSKAAEKNKNKKRSSNAPSLSKQKLRKLKKLQEAKRIKLLEGKSLEILGKCQLPERARSLIFSSTTIGQCETVKEKRRRAVEFCKAGFTPPEDDPKCKKNKSDELLKDQNSPFDPEDSPLDPEEMQVSDAEEGFHCNTNIQETSELMIQCEIPNHRTNSLAIAEKNVAVKNDLIQSQTITSPPSSSFDLPHVIEAKPETTGKPQLCSKIADANQEHRAAPTVVHVQRPQEVVEKRTYLPIIMMEQEIMEAVFEHSVVILCGETGCGKTTQVPQFLYEAGYGSSSRIDRKGMVGVTQPRRVAVLATAKRVSYELGLSLGKEVGFQVRHDKMIGSKSSIKFMTDGILLREVQSDFLLRRYSVIILDEAHERSLNTDILIGMLSRVIKIRQDLYKEQQAKMCSGLKICPQDRISPLKLILMSATLRVDDFLSNKKLFDVTPPVVQVPVRQFPVTVHFSKKTVDDYIGQAYKKIMSIHKRLPPGGILVFVTGQREVDFLCKKLRRAAKHFAGRKPSTPSNYKVNITSEAEMKEISEAYDLKPNSDYKDEMSSAGNEDEYTPELDISSSDVETGSEMETDSEDEVSIMDEAPEKTGLMSDFLLNGESLTMLKASFDALYGKAGNSKCEENPSPAVQEGDQHTDIKAPTASGMYILPLYAMLPASEQLRVFQDVPDGDRLVVVATNVAETSLTIPGIKYVVDTGKEKIKNYNHSTGMASYDVQWISKASSAQRAGRAGRTGPGHCYRLYSAGAFSKDDLFPEFPLPEILKIPVDGVVLLMKYMGIDKVSNFPFPSPPERTALLEAERCLKSLEALDAEDRLTPMGSAMAQYPMSPRHSRALLTVISILRKQEYGRSNYILGFAVAAVAALSFPSPFYTQFGAESCPDDMNQEDKSEADALGDQQDRKSRKKVKKMSREAHARFCNPTSDALTTACALQLFEGAGNSVEFCEANYLHLKTMEDISKLRKQLLQLIFCHGRFCPEYAWTHGNLEDVERVWRNCSDNKRLQMSEEELLRQAICAGWADRVAKRVHSATQLPSDDEKVRAARYQSCALNDTVYLHRFSSLSRSAPEYLVYSELICTKRPYMHGATGVKAEWLLKYAGSLCAYSAPLTDPKPYYEPLSDQVFCYVSPTFGCHNWQLPLHSLPIKDQGLRLRVFACALLKGDVLPCLRTVQKMLAITPSTILGPINQRRVGDVLNRMKAGSKLIDSRAKLRDAWMDDPHFLYSEIQSWFQDSFLEQFKLVWQQMQQEAILDGRELFPRVKSKRASTLAK